MYLNCSDAHFDNEDRNIGTGESSCGSIRFVFAREAEDIIEDDAEGFIAAEGKCTKTNTNVGNIEIIVEGIH